MTIGNSAQRVPVDPGERVQWLVDRAAISDLLSAFARTLDTGDWHSYGDLMADDVVFMFGDHVVADGREAFVKDAMKSMGRYHATWHITGNPGIEIDGDIARSRSYSVGVHRITADDQGVHSTGAGWYDCEFRRDADRWRFAVVRLTIVWTAGENDRPA